MPFYSPITLSPFKDKFITDDIIVYYSKDYDKAIFIPKGFVTDLASVPAVLQWIVNDFGSHTGAAILHDYLYSTNLVARKVADIMFLEAMLESGVPRFRAHAMYQAVRLFGWMFR